MSDQNPGNNAPDTQDPYKNLKAELDRKISNTSTEVTEMRKANEALTAQIAELTRKIVAPAPAATQSEDLSDLFYKDPARYAQIVADRAAAQADKIARQREDATRKTNTTLANLQNEYPELSDSSSELTKKAVEIYNSLPDDERNSSMAYKLAVQSAAVDLGVKPRSKRPVDDEPMGNPSYSGGRGGRRQSNKLDPATEELAQMFGLDTSKADVKDSLIQRAQRDWSKYKPVSKKR
jgi:hypothetical protein